MELPFELCRLLPQRISLWGGGASRPDLQHQMNTIVDELGTASAKAQGLAAPITSAAKMKSTNHHLYILRDCTPKMAGKGVVIGFLKVGNKKLFVLDRHGVHHEEDVLCVLDFYVHESLQRHGHGKELFEHMLQEERMEPHQMAVDRPSEKLICFLRKHYGLKSTIPQVNNFVVFDGFFRDRNAPARKKLPPKRRPEGEIKPYSSSEREFLKQEVGLPWPFSQPDSSPSKGAPRPLLSEQELLKNLQICCPRPTQGEMNGGPCDAAGPRRRTSGSTSQQGLVAYRNSYSRYGNLDTRGASPAESAGWGAGDGAPEINSNPREPAQRGMYSGEQPPPTATAEPLQPLYLRGLNVKKGAGLQAEPPDPLRLDKPQIAGHVEKALGVGSRGHPQPSDPAELLRKNNEPAPSPARGIGSKRLHYDHAAGEEHPGKELRPPLGHLKAERPPTPKHTWSYRPSWTVLGAPINAQWVRQKHEFRSTRPW